jgi:hypothetical protein
MSSQTAVLLLTHITFTLLAFTALLVKMVAVARAVVLIIFIVCIKGFRQLLRLISVA